MIDSSAPRGTGAAPPPADDDASGTSLDTTTSESSGTTKDSELSGVTEDVAREAMRLAIHKLPMKARFIKREAGEI